MAQALSFAFLAILVIGAYLYPNQQNLLWIGLVLYGSYILGAIWEPGMKTKFPKEKAAALEQKGDASLVLNTQEAMHLYYATTALIAIAIGAMVCPTFYGFELTKGIADHQTLAFIATTGLLNSCIFWFFDTGIRYGDISVVSATRGLIPVLALPVSYGLFSLYPEKMPSPHVSKLGLSGILLIVASLAINGYRTKRKEADPDVPNWFAAHPITSGVIGACFASCAITFDALGVNAGGNPFLVTCGMPMVVSFVMGFWCIKSTNLTRIKTLWAHYWREALWMGMYYALCTSAFNMSLLAENVNYQGGVKRTSIVFATIYGTLVLKEGEPAKRRERIVLSIMITLGVFMIMLAK